MMIVLLLGVAWAWLVWFALNLVSSRFVVTERLALVDSSSSEALGSGTNWLSNLVSKIAGLPFLALILKVCAAPVRRAHQSRLRISQEAEIPITVELLQVALGSGASPYQACTLAADWVPSQSAVALRNVVHACELGASFSDALEMNGETSPLLMRISDTVASSLQTGAPLTRTLGELSSQLRGEVRRRAETRARKVPVRLIFPLVFLVLPAFALLTVVPALISGISRL